MSEEEIIEAVNYHISLVDKKGWCSIGKEELQGLLDLYNKQKERIKELEEIEKEHQKQNGELQEKIKELEEKYNKIVTCHLRYEELTGIDLLMPDKSNVISKDKIKEKIEELENIKLCSDKFYKHLTEMKIKLLQELLEEEK